MGGPARRRLALTVAAATAGLVGAALAGGAPAPVAPELRAVVSTLKRTRVPILLPGILPYDRVRGQRLRAVATARVTRWGVSLFFGRTCGANACTVGFFEAERGGKPTPFRQRVTLAGGIQGRYKPTTCGASCSPPELDWARNGVVYRIQLRVPASKAHERALMIEAANSAISTGRR